MKPDPRQFTTVAVLLAALAGPGSLPSGTAEQPGETAGLPACLVATALDAASAPLSEDRLELGLLAESSGVEAIDVDCTGPGLSHLAVEVLPQQDAEIRLVLRHAITGDTKVAASITDRSGSPLNWLEATVDTQTASSGALPTLTLTLAGGSHAPPGSRHQTTLSVSAQTGADNYRTELPLTIEIAEEAPLFRDRFEDVDPVLGQFSYLSPREHDSAGFPGGG